MSNPLLSVANGNLIQVAESLETGRLVPPFTSFSIGRFVPAQQREALANELTRLSEAGMEVSHLVYLLRTVIEQRLASQKSDRVVELVWTGPEVPGAESRDTAVLVEELFATAEESVLIAGFAVAQGKRIFKTLSDRMRELPELRVRMFLNVPRPYRDLTNEAELLKRFADKFRLSEWPGSRIPEVYFDRRALAVANFDRASLHAKCIVVDEGKTLLTSANFTAAAQLRNIEAGVFIADESFAHSLTRQFEALITNGLLQRMPGLS